MLTVNTEDVHFDRRKKDAMYLKGTRGFDQPNFVILNFPRHRVTDMRHVSSLYLMFYRGMNVYNAYDTMTDL